MRAFPFDRLPRLRPRRWLPEELVADSWEKVEPFFDDLERRDVDTSEALENWLMDSNELAMALRQEGTGRHVRTTLDTEDPEIEAAWRQFAEQLSPKTSPRWHALERKYLASPARKQLDRARWRVYDRDAESGHELFREENIPLGVEISRLDQEYNRLRGAMGANLDGRELTAIQLGELQESPDRDLRERAWRALWGLYLENEQRFEGIYQRMLELRIQTAKNAGFDDYRAYAWKCKGRYDYTPQDCLTFHDAIEETVVPLLRKLTAVRRERLGLEVVRPWDVRVDLSGKPALAAVTGTQQFCRAMTDILGSVDPELSSLFATELAGRGMLDLESRRGKAPGGYQTVFAESGLPFIFNNGAGTDDDLTILAHEAGHAFHSLLCRDEPLLAYRHAPTEFSEVASSTMEFFTYEHMGRLHSDPADLARSRWFRLWRVLEKLVGVGTFDGFQHWVYTNPRQTVAERQHAWRRLHERFDPRADWTGLEKERSVQWWDKLHLFVSPFYYVEYGIAYVGALQLWLKYRQDPAGALAGYRRALALGGSRPLPELWEAAGIEFDFSARVLGPLVREVEKAFEQILEMQAR